MTGVMTVHQVSEGQAQHIGQRLQRVDVWQPDAAFPAADGFIRNVKLLSQFGLRHVPLPAHLCKECTKFFLHPFCSHPFPQDNTGMWEIQPTERLPASLQNKKDVLPCGNTSFLSLQYQAEISLQLGAGRDQSLTGLVALVLDEVLDEAACQILGLLFPLGSVSVGVARVEDAGVDAVQLGRNLEVEVRGWSWSGPC